VINREKLGITFVIDYFLFTIYNFSKAFGGAEPPPYDKWCVTTHPTWLNYNNCVETLDAGKAGRSEEITALDIDSIVHKP
jgi:hypothetical protein